MRLNELICCWLLPDDLVLAVLSILVIALLRSPLTHHPQSPCTFYIIGLNTLIFFHMCAKEYNNNTLLEDYRYVRYLLIEKGQVYRIFTSCLLHADVMHLYHNMDSIWYIGHEAALERRTGWPAFLLVYILGHLGGLLAMEYLTPSDVSPRFGASAGVNGLVGCWLVLLAGDEMNQVAAWPRPFFSRIRAYFNLPTMRYTCRLVIPVIVPAVIMVVRGPKEGDRIGHVGHLGGILVGVALGLALLPMMVGGPPPAVAAAGDVGDDGGNGGGGGGVAVDGAGSIASRVLARRRHL